MKFLHFFPKRVIPECFKSAWKVETSRLLTKNKSIFNLSNPFYVYLSLALFFSLLSFLIGGFWAVCLFLIQALVAVLHLEVVNYIEHYGLSRQKIDDEKYEPTKPFHSWNANHAASNLLLINLQKTFRSSQDQIKLIHYLVPMIKILHLSYLLGILLW